MLRDIPHGAECRVVYLSFLFSRVRDRDTCLEEFIERSIYRIIERLCARVTKNIFALCGKKSMLFKRTSYNVAHLKCKQNPVVSAVVNER